MSRSRYRGWRIAWALALSQTVGYGVLYYVYAVFTLPMEAEFGWSRTETSGAFSLALLVSGLIALPVGRLVDRHGARTLMGVASAGGALLVLAWSLVESLPALYLIQAGIGAAMAATLYDVAFAVIATWFRRERIRALLVVTMVAGFASTVFVPLATALVEGIGWRAALRVLALILALVAVPLHALVLRREPAQFGLEPDGRLPRGSGEEPDAPEPSVTPRSALRTASFWWLGSAFALERIVIVALAAHGMPLLLERGYPPALAAAALGSIGLMQVAGRLLFAPAAERTRLAPLATLTFGLRAVALLLLLLLPGLVGLWLFAGLFGVANGAGTLARAGLVAEAFGPAHFGGINGAMTTLIALAQTAAPLAIGALRSTSGSYTTSLAVMLAVTLIAGAAIDRAGRAMARSERAPE